VKSEASDEATKLLVRAAVWLVYKGMKSAGKAAYRSYKAYDQQSALSLIKVEVLRAESLIPADAPLLDNNPSLKDMSSDPYVVLKQGYIEKSTNYVAKTLNPSWNETIELPIVDASEPLLIEVKDRDNASDDDLGGYVIQLKDVPSDQPKEFVLALVGVMENNPGRLYLRMQAVGLPLHFLSASLNKDGQPSYERWQQDAAPWRLNIHLLRAENLIVGDLWTGKSDGYVVFKQGRIEHRSRVVQQDLNPVWDQRFEMGVLDVTGYLEVQVWDEDTKPARDDDLGRAVVRLQDIGPEEKEFVLQLLSPGLTANTGFVFVRLQLTGPPSNSA
jgi:Ca2+-dependent lipid-binding protein